MKLFTMTWNSEISIYLLDEIMNILWNSILVLDNLRTLRQTASLPRPKKVTSHWINSINGYSRTHESGITLTAVANYT